MLERVLIVEENDKEFERIKKLLSFEQRFQEGPYVPDPQKNISRFPEFSFNRAENGEDALRQVGQAVDDHQSFCLVLMDIEQTELNQSFFYPREIRKTDNDIQIIITTDPDHAYWNHIADALGNRDFILFLKKPYKPIELKHHALVLFSKWHRTKLTENKLHEVNEAYDLMAIERMKADQENTSKGDFLANMSHEIRTPLNIILGIHEVLQDTPLNEDQKKYVGMANRSGEQLLSLINTLLNLSKIEAGKESINPTEFHLVRFLNELFEVFAFKAELNKVGFHSHIAQDIPEYAKTDREKLKIILTNLLDNAVKFSKGARVKVSITKETGTIKDKVYIKCEIEDTGIGIPKEDLHNIFKNFYQVKSNAAKGFKGTGLGLSLTNKYVSMLSGTITAKSELGKGALFKIVLPVEVSEDLKVNRQLDQKGTDQKLGRPLNILLAEDNMDNVQLMKVFFKDEACKIDVADNGQTAAEMFTDHDYDVIFMDIDMPIMDGIEATKVIRKIEREQKKTCIPIIALTAFSRDNEIEACMKAGCDDVFKKPIKRSKLMAYLHQLIGSAGASEKDSTS